jgi:hypothetical protein
MASWKGGRVRPGGEATRYYGSTHRRSKDGQGTTFQHDIVLTGLTAVEHQGLQIDIPSKLSVIAVSGGALLELAAAGECAQPVLGELGDDVPTRSKAALRIRRGRAMGLGGWPQEAKQVAQLAGRGRHRRRMMAVTAAPGGV